MALIKMSIGVRTMMTIGEKSRLSTLLLVALLPLRIVPRGRSTLYSLGNYDMYYAPRYYAPSAERQYVLPSIRRLRACALSVRTLTPCILCFS